jgi:ABC-type transport system substrate-binding protein
VLEVTRAAIVIGLAAVAVLLLAAAGHPQAGAEGGTLRMAIPADDFDALDPALTQLAGTTTVVRLTCASLMGAPDKPFPTGSRIVPDLATGYPKITNSGKTYTYTIRKDARFSTGASVTAQDVAFTINRVLNPALKTYRAAYLSDIVGAKAVLAGRTQEAAGIVARGNRLTIRLTKPLGDFNARVAVAVCVVPTAVGTDPEGVKPPVPTAAPYAIAEYVAGDRVVIERNRFYHGARPHRVDRVVVDLSLDEATALDRVEGGTLDYAWVPTADYADRAAELRRKHGLNRKRFFAVPASFLRYFTLNTARPLFKGNEPLRRAVNFAVDRKALLRARGPLAGFLTDQYLPPGLPGFRDADIYPLAKPDLKRARQLARGATRSGKAMLYTPAATLGSTQAQIVKANLARIGLAVTIRKIPASLYFQKLATPHEPFDIAWNGWLADLPDPSLLNDLFEGKNVPEPNNSRFDSPVYNARLDRASRLVGQQRYATYGRIDVDLARDAAPAIAYAYDNALTLVGPRVGCVVVNPYLDLATVCLK